MKIDEAMRILDDIVECGEYEGDPDDSAAVKLGIEALKAIRRDRNLGMPWAINQLLGETKD